VISSIHKRSSTALVRKRSSAFATPPRNLPAPSHRHSHARTMSLPALTPPAFTRRIAFAAEFDQPLEAPKDDSIPELDLSSMSVKDNDGSPLVEPAPDVAPSVTPPNFDLDAPGALLETIGLPEPVAMPDLSALSVRASEGDLLESHERQDAAPVIVDTSRLTVSENT